MEKARAGLRNKPCENFISNQYGTAKIDINNVDRGDCFRNHKIDESEYNNFFIPNSK